MCGSSFSMPLHHAPRGGTVPSLCPRRRLPGRSLKKNRTSDKLELTLSDMSEVLLFFLFVSLPAIPAPAEDAPALFRRALLAVRDAPALIRCALLAVRDAPELFRCALPTVRDAPALSCLRFLAPPRMRLRDSGLCSISLTRV